MSNENENMSNFIFLRSTNKIAANKRQDLTNIQIEDNSKRISVRLTWKNVKLYIPNNKNPERKLNRSIKNN